MVGVFSVQMTKDQNCELRLVAPLDREKQSDYQLTLQLDSGLLVNNTNAITSALVSGFMLFVLEKSIVSVPASLSNNCANFIPKENMRKLIWKIQLTAQHKDRDL